MLVEMPVPVATGEAIQAVTGTLVLPVPLASLHMMLDLVAMTPLLLTVASAAVLLMELEPVTTVLVETAVKVRKLRQPYDKTYC